MTTLEIEFSRYKMIAKLSAFYNTQDNYRDNYENMNILERWLLTAANDTQPGEDPFFAERKFADDYVHTAKMYSEFQDKKIKNFQYYYDTFKKMAREWLARDLAADVKPKVFEMAGVMRIFDGELSYYYAFPKELFDFYTSRATREQLAIICLRYACTLQRAQHWAMPYELYSVIFGYYGAEIEGFASPLNTQIMKYNKRGKFCSLFYDTDKPMGSIGSFFTHDYIGKTIMAGPPYIQPIYDMILKVVLEHMERSERENIPMRFFISISGWADTPLAMELDKHKFTRKKYVTKRNETYFIDTKRDTYVAFSPDNFVYVVSNGYPDENYDKLTEAFDHIEKSTMRLVGVSGAVKKLKTDKVVDLSQIIKKRNYRNIKQCFDFLYDNKKIPTNILDLFKHIDVNQDGIVCNVVGRAAFSIPGLKFPWSVIYGKCKTFMDTMKAQKFE